MRDVLPERAPGHTMPWRGPILLALLTVSASCVPPDSPVHSFEAALAGLPCNPAIVTALEEWGARGAPLQAPPSVPGALSLRFPTAVLGEWVVVEAPPLGPPVVARMTAEGITARLFDLSCGPEERHIARPSSASGAGVRFTDGDLRAAIESANGRAVIVYAWAPHMPLSVDGYPEIATAGAALDAVVLPLLIGHSDRPFAEREAARVGIPTEGLREIDANELVLRDLQLHAPSILVFTPERISPVLPGYRDAGGYRRYLEALLAGPSR